MEIYQKKTNWRVRGTLNRLLKVLIIAINAQSHSVDIPSPPPPPSWFGDGDHLCPYGRKLIGSFVPVHRRSVRCNKYAFLNPSLKLVAFLLNYFTCLDTSDIIPKPGGGGGGGVRLQSDCAFIAIIRSLFKASDTFHVFQVLIKMADSHRNCQGSRFIYFTLFTQH